MPSITCCKWSDIAVKVDWTSGCSGRGTQPRDYSCYGIFGCHVVHVEVQNEEAMLAIDCRIL
jgi:hypothetical protein